MKTRWTLAAALLLSLLAHGPLLAGVVFEVETTDHSGSGRPGTTEVMAEGKNLKMTIAPGSRQTDGEMIFRGDRREMVVVDHDDKSYVVMDEEAISQIGGQVSDAMAQVQEALKNVPEDQRAMVEKMMKERMPHKAPPAASRPRSEVRKTGERAEKNGYPCVKYEVWTGGRKPFEMWVTDWSNVEGGGEAREAFEEMADFFQEMMDSIGELTGGGMPGATLGGDNPFEHMKELGGFPVVTREFGDDGSLEGESSLRSARRRTLDPADFEPPAGYKRRSMLGGS